MLSFSPDTGSLVAKGVQVNIGSSVLLTNFSFTLYPGEFCALIGPSGAGKSTLMKVLLGIKPVTVSVRRVDGKLLFQVAYASKCAYLLVCSARSRLQGRFLRHQVIKSN